MTFFTDFFSPSKFFFIISRSIEHVLILASILIRVMGCLVRVFLIWLISDFMVKQVSHQAKTLCSSCSYIHIHDYYSPSPYICLTSYFVILLFLSVFFFNPSVLHAYCLFLVIRVLKYASNHFTKKKRVHLIFQLQLPNMVLKRKKKY